MNTASHASIPVTGSYEVDGHKIEYLVQGSGPGVVIVHGIGGR